MKISVRIGSKSIRINYGRRAVRHACSLRLTQKEKKKKHQIINYIIIKEKRKRNKNRFERDLFNNLLQMKRIFFFLIIML